MTVNGTYANRADRIRKMRKAKRKQAICRKYIMGGTTLILVLSLALSTHVFSAKAKSVDSETVLYKYYKNVVVQTNDTLWGFALENYCSEKQTLEEYIHEVQNINHLEDEQLVVGNHIVLPYYSSEFVYYAFSE